MMKGFWSAGTVLLLLAACQAAAPEDDPPRGLPTSLPLIGGYRSPGDSCRRVGEDAFTNPFLDDAADLVACPKGDVALSGLGPGSGARVVATKDDWVLISVPRR
jgi:hypothetical protein